MIQICDKTLSVVGARITRSGILEFQVSDLNDPTRPEESNGGNYCDYEQYRYDQDGFSYREFSSYHGDIEPFPEWEHVSQHEWEWRIVATIVYLLNRI